MPTEEQLWAVFECIDEYLGTQEELSKALKDGLFNIARGKYTLGAALGQQRYPGDMQATSFVHVCPSTNEDEIYDEFNLHQHNPAQTRRSSTACDTAAENSTSSTKDDTLSAAYSGSETAAAAAAAAAASKHDKRQDFHNDPLHWFTALPPQPVRQAQVDFNTALQRAVAAANAAQRLRKLAADLRLNDNGDAGSAAESTDNA